MRIDTSDVDGPRLSTCGGAVDHLQRVGQEVLAELDLPWPEVHSASPQQLASLGAALQHM